MRKTEIKHKDVFQTYLDEYLNRDAESRYMKRLQIVDYLLHNEGASCNAAAKLFNVSPKAVQIWVNKINETGDLESLRDQPGKGRKTRMTTAQQAQIEKALRTSPKKAGLKGKEWNGAILVEYIQQKIGIELKIRQCQRILQKYGAATSSGRPVN